MWREESAQQMSRIIWLRSMSVRILKNVVIRRNTQKTMDRLDCNPGRFPGFHEYVGIFCKYSERLKERFPVFLKKNLSVNPMKCEYFLPEVVSNLLSEGKATVEVRKSLDKWYGVTYKEDKPFVVAAIQSLKDQGLYPQKLWEE